MSETPREKLLAEAIVATTCERNRDYGEPKDNFERAMVLIRAWRQISPTGNNVSMINYLVELILVKLARLANSPDHWDSWKDIAGYAACAAEVMQKLNRPFAKTWESPDNTKPSKFDPEETSKLK